MLEDNQSSVEKYKLLKIFVVWVAANKLSANKQQKNDTTYILVQSSTLEKMLPSDDVICKRQELLNQVIHLLTESNVSPEKFRQLETRIEDLVESSVSRDYLLSELRDKAKEGIKDLQKLFAAITNIDKKKFYSRGASIYERIEKIKLQLYRNNCERN